MKHLDDLVRTIQSHIDCHCHWCNLKLHGNYKDHDSCSKCGHLVGQAPIVVWNVTWDKGSLQVRAEFAHAVSYAVQAAGIVRCGITAVPVEKERTIVASEDNVVYYRENRGPDRHIAYDLGGIDWMLLARQKQKLLRSIQDEPENILWGLVELIDQIQDEGDAHNLPVVWATEAGKGDIE